MMTRVGALAGAASLLAAASAIVAWRDEPATSPAMRPAGAALFAAKGCGLCHAGPDSTPLQFQGVPSLVGASRWAGQRREAMDAATYLAESIRSPTAFISPTWGGAETIMPDLGLTEAEIDALVDYLLQG